MFYERDPAHLPEATLLLTGENGPNLKPYFRNDKVRFEFEVTGTSSARSVLSLTGCFYTKARID